MHGRGGFCYNSEIMKNPKDPGATPLPIPETMEEIREMALHAMTLAAKTAVSLSRTEKLVKRVARLAGDSSRNTVRVLERDIMDRIEEDGKLAWMPVDRIYHHIRASEPHPGRPRPPAEEGEDERDIGKYDLVVVNPKEALVVEVRRVLRADEARLFAQEVVAFPRRFPEIAAGRVIYGAVAFALEEGDLDARKDAMDAVKDAGLMLIRAVGKTGLKIPNPDPDRLRAIGRK